MKHPHEGYSRIKAFIRPHSSDPRSRLASSPWPTNERPVTFSLYERRESADADLPTIAFSRASRCDLLGRARLVLPRRLSRSMIQAPALVTSSVRDQDRSAFCRSQALGRITFMKILPSRQLLAGRITSESCNGTRTYANSGHSYHFTSQWDQVSCRLTVTVDSVGTCSAP